MANILNLVMPVITSVSKTAKNSDITELLNQITSALNLNSRSSIANLARQNIAYYPILASSNISKSAYLKAQVILENLYANYIRLVIINSNLIFDRNTNAYTVLRKFHDNDTFSDGSVESGMLNNDPYLNSTNESANITYSAAKITEENFRIANIESMTPYEENFNFKNINSNEYSSEILTESKNNSIEIYNPATYTLYLSNQIEYLTKKNSKDKRIPKLQEKINSLIRIIKSSYNKTDSFNRISKPIKHVSLTNDSDPRQQSEIDKNNAEAERAKAEAKLAETRQKTEESKITLNNAQAADIINKTASDKIKFKKEMKNMHEMIYDRDISTINTEIKKLNDLEPSIIKLQFPVTSEEGYNLGNKTINLGVKCVTHVIDSAEMDSYLPRSIMENSLLLKLTKISTGEKHFFKDILLNVDINRKQAYDNKGTERFWRHLQARSKANKLLKTIGARGFIPNATIILSKEDVEFIKIKDNIDFYNNPTYARKLMDIYFLLHLVILDEISETLYIFDSYTGTWQQTSYKSKDKGGNLNLVMPSVKY